VDASGVTPFNSPAGEEAVAAASPSTATFSERLAIATTWRSRTRSAPLSDARMSSFENAQVPLNFAIAASTTSPDTCPAGASSASPTKSNTRSSFNNGTESDGISGIVPRSLPSTVSDVIIAENSFDRRLQVRNSELTVSCGSTAF
jgi:hypothetical protein